MKANAQLVPRVSSRQTTAPTRARRRAGTAPQAFTAKVAGVMKSELVHAARDVPMTSIDRDALAFPQARAPRVRDATQARTGSIATTSR